MNHTDSQLSFAVTETDKPFIENSLFIDVVERVVIRVPISENAMPVRERFSLRDLLILGLALVVMASVFVAACENPFSPPRSRTRMRNGTRARGIQQACVLYSQSNNEHYPGYDSDGNDDFAPLQATANRWGSNALTDDDIGKVYALLINAEMFTAGYVVSPDDDWTVAAKESPVRGVITPANYSYALLDMNDPGSNRRNEWRDTNNSQAPLVADPSADIRPMYNVTYLSSELAYKNSDTAYKGNIAWNDNHVTFENAALFAPGKLKMGDTLNAVPLNPFKNTANDGAKFIW